MVDNDSYFLAKVSLVGAATAAILDSKHVIPPEVRHYLNLLRSLCRDVRLLWDLREKRMNYLTATLHDLREVDGVLATMTLDAAKFEPLLAKYQPTEAVSSITPGQGGPLEPERTAWTTDDVKHLCKMAENLSFQTETIQAIITRLGGGIMQSSLDTRRDTPPPEPAAGYGKIENVELFKGLFAPAPPPESGRSVSRKSLPAASPVARASVSSQKDQTLSPGQSHGSPMSTHSSVARTSTNGSRAPTSPSAFVAAQQGNTLGDGQGHQHHVPASHAQMSVAQPNRAFGLQALFQPLAPLMPQQAPTYTGDFTTAAQREEYSSVPGPPTDNQQSRSRWTIQGPPPQTQFSSLSGGGDQSPPSYEHHHLQPQVSTISMRSSEHSPQTAAASVVSLCSDSTSIHSFLEQRRHTQSSMQAPSIYPPRPGPAAFPARHTISEMTSLPEVAVMPRSFSDEYLPEVVSRQQPPGYFQQQQQQQQQQQHQYGSLYTPPPGRTAPIQVHQATSKAAELQRMFAPVPKLGETKKILPYNYTGGSTNTGQQQQQPHQQEQIPGHTAVPQRRHYSSPSTMLTEARTRSDSQPLVPRPMYFELETAGAAATALEVAESVASDKTPTGAGETQPRESTTMMTTTMTGQFDIPQGCLWDPPEISSGKSYVDQNNGSSQPGLRENFEHNNHYTVGGNSAANPSTINSTSSNHVAMAPPHSEEKSGRTISEAFTAARNIMPTPSVFRKNRNKTDSAAWLRRSQMFGSGQ